MWKRGLSRREAVHRTGALLGFESAGRDDPVGPEHGHSCQQNRSIGKVTFAGFDNNGASRVVRAIKHRLPLKIFRKTFIRITVIDARSNIFNRRLEKRQQRALSMTHAPQVSAVCVSRLQGR